MFWHSAKPHPPQSPFLRKGEDEPGIRASIIPFGTKGIAAQAARGWLSRAARTNRDPGIGFLLYDLFILRYRDDPRFVAFCRKVDLPDTTDAVAMK